MATSKTRTTPCGDDRTPRVTSLVLFMTVLCAVLGGCDRSDRRQAISGVVTSDRQTLAGAIIHFRPVGDNKGPSSGTVIGDDGTFAIPAAKGLIPGKYTVDVQLWKETDRTFTSPSTGKPVKITAPVRFLESGKLDATVVNGVNHFKYHLTVAE